MNNLVTRTLSGGVFVIIVLGSILLGAYSFAIMMITIIVWAMLEFYGIVVKGKINASKIIGIFSGVSLFVAGFLYARDIVCVKVFLLFIPLLSALFISQLYSAEQNTFRTFACTLTGVVYIALPFTLLNGIIFSSGGKYLPDILLGFFVLSWVNDSFAYLTGIAFGKHRLFERISPKKSWEGFFGGLICTVAISALIATMFPVLSYYHWMAVAAIIVVFGVYGDLIESLLKRNFNLKDSGRFLPGHGGILDRFDSMLLAAPMVYFYLKLVIF